MESMVERVGNALAAVQLFSRWNDWTSDCVEGMPIEICRYGKDGEEEIVVVRRFDRSWKEEDALTVTIKEALARAALEALREPTEKMLDAGKTPGWSRWEVRGRFNLMIDAALIEEGEEA